LPRKRETSGAAAPDPALFGKCQNFPDDPAAFEAFCRAYPAPNPAGMVSYVYRLADPKIDRAQTGHAENYLEKLAGEIVTADVVARAWGSGRFMLIYCDTARAQHQQVAKCTFSIDDPHLEPVVDPAEIVICDQNARWVSKYKALGWTVETRTSGSGREFQQLVPPAKAAATGGPDQVLAQTVKELALQQRAEPAANSVVIDRELFNLLLKQSGSGRDDSLERAFAIADRLKPNENVTATLVTKLADLVMKERNPHIAPPPGADPITQLRTTAEFLKELGWAAPGAAAGRGASWIDAIAALPGILQHGATLLSQLVALQMRAPAGAVDRDVSPASARPAVLAPGPEPAAAPVNGDPMNPLKLQAMMDVGRRAIAAFEAGVAGDDFAEQLCQSPETESIYDDLLAMGRDQIVNALAMVPGLDAKLAPRRAEYVAWLDSFLAYGSEDATPEAPQAVQ
jgi:hypothetical protein